MAINDKAYQQWIAEIREPGGSKIVYLSDDEAQSYNADPDAYAARHFGMSDFDYAEWIECNGVPLCGATTKRGDLCRQQVAGQQNAADFVAQHRHLFCATHDPDRSAS